MSRRMGKEENEVTVMDKFGGFFIKGREIARERRKNIKKKDCKREMEKKTQRVEDHEEGTTSLSHGKRIGKRVLRL